MFFKTLERFAGLVVIFAIGGVVSLYYFYQQIGIRIYLIEYDIAQICKIIGAAVIVALVSQAMVWWCDQ